MKFLRIQDELNFAKKRYELTKKIEESFVDAGFIQIKPEIFESMGSTLFICLSGVIVIELIMMFVGIVTPQWWDWLVVLLSCGYIGYDWSKAQEKRKTLDNAVDSAVDLYLDIINLFVRLLGSKDDD